MATNHLPTLLPLTTGALGYAPLGIATAEDNNVEQMITKVKTPTVFHKEA